MILFRRIPHLSSFVLKCLYHLRRRSSFFFQKRKDLASEARTAAGSIPLTPLFDAITGRSHDEPGSGDAVDRVLAGTFDLLGTGWISRRAGGHVFEDQKPRHLAFSDELRRMVSPEYGLLDWQLDPRSGKGGSAGLFWTDNMALSGKVPGFDIKQPWELGRMQYLPELALFALNHPERYETLKRFFQDSVLDFCASNPFGMGCQWACSMDVAVRAVNLLIAYSLFRTAGHTFDPGFESLFSNLIVLHGRHIRMNPEKQVSFANNHYLADICGLIFIGAALKKTHIGRKWFSFASKEFRKELHHQFRPDGGNFEASTTYHVQTGEMAVYTLALLAGEGEIGRWPVSEQQFAANLVFKIRSLAEAAVAPDGKVVQIGDNDSGVFLNLAPARLQKNGKWKEERRIVTGFLAAASALLSEETIVSHPDGALVHALMKGETLPPVSVEEEADKRPFVQAADQNIPELPFKKEETFSFTPAPAEQCELSFFPDFGLAVWKSSSFWMSLFWGQPGQCGVGGHSHNDKLSMILYLNGKPVLNDPGSFCYTSDPDMRNRYRSWRNHPFAVPVTDPKREFADCRIFSFPAKFGTEVRKISAAGMELLLTMQGAVCFRTIDIGIREGTIRVRTVSSTEIRTGGEELPFSDGYGSIENIA